MNETTTLDGETLDFVIFRVFGRVNEGLLEQTYQLNPDLAEYGTVLPVGVVVKLPEVPATQENPTIHLWS